MGKSSRTPKTHMAEVFPSPPIVHPIPLDPAKCPVCGVEKPQTSEYWSLTKHGSAGAMCMTCCGELGKTGTEVHMARQAKETRDEFGLAIRNEAGIPRLRQIVNALLTEIGGVDKLAKYWCLDFHDAKPGSRMRFDFYKTFCGMVAVCDEEVNREVDTLSDVDLEAELQQRTRMEVLKTLESYGPDASVEEVLSHIHRTEPGVGNISLGPEVIDVASTE